MDYKPTRRKRRSRYFTGEDIDMLRERERERKRDTHKNICDTNIDGAQNVNVTTVNHCNYKAIT